MTNYTRIDRNAAALARSPNYEAHVRAKYGMGPRDLEIVARMGTRLGHPGQALTSTDIKQLQRIYSHVDPREVADLADKLNNAHSGSRQTLFGCLLAGDADGLRTGVPKTQDAIDANIFFQTYGEFELANKVDTRLDERVPHDAVTIRAPAPREDDTRSVIESLLPPSIEDGLEMSSEQVQRDYLGARMDASMEKLKDEELSTRDTLAAAFDFDRAVGLGRDLNLMPEEE